MKFPSGSNGAAAAPSGTQWKGLDECVNRMKSEGRSKAHVFKPSKETKVVTCAKVQFGEILHAAKYEAVFYMTVQGGRDFELPEYEKVKNGVIKKLKTNIEMKKSCYEKLKKKRTKHIS